MTAAESTPTGGYGEAGNGREEIRVSGWGASLAARGTNVILVAGIFALGATNWYALRILRDEIHDHMLTVDKTAAEAQQRKWEISEEHKLLLARIAEDNKELVKTVKEGTEAVQAAVWVMAQDAKLKLQLPEPPGIRNLRQRSQEQDPPIRAVPRSTK